MSKPRKWVAYVRKEYSVEQCAYMAGLVDGEGSLVIAYPKRRDFQTYITITSTTPKIIEWIVGVFGGSITTYTQKQTPKNSRKMAYKWQATGYRLDHIIEVIYPYLTEKKEQAAVLIEMRKTFSIHYRGVKGKPGAAALPDEIVKKRIHLWETLKALHVRGYSNHKFS